MDWYIKKYHADSYIHVSNIVDEIGTRIKNVEDRINTIRDNDIEDALKTERTKHKIIEDGYIAEIMSMEKIVADARRMRSETEELHFKVVRRAKELVLLSSESKHERIEIVNDLSATIGKLDKQVIEAERVNKEIEDTKKEDEKILRLK